MLGLGLPEILIVLLIVVLLFGARKLPEIGRGLGSGMREFKEGVTGKDSDEQQTLNSGEQTPPQPTAAREPQETRPPGDAD